MVLRTGPEEREGLSAQDNWSSVPPNLKLGGRQIGTVGSAVLSSSLLPFFTRN